MKVNIEFLRKKKHYMNDIIGVQIQSCGQTKALRCTIKLVLGGPSSCQKSWLTNPSHCLIDSE